MVLHYLQNNQIDKQKWDAKIRTASNGRIYALSWYLDAMCPEWYAIVSEDYEFVMPLPVRKKWGISYIFQPAFTQQLGIFSLEKCTEEITAAFIHKIKMHYRYAELNFNSENILGEQFEFIAKKNYLLPLNESFQSLRESFSRSAKRNISKALQNNITVEVSNDFSELIELHRQRYGNKYNFDQDFIALGQMLKKAVENESACFFYAKNADGKAVASSAYLKFNERIIFLVNGNIEEALVTGATHLLKSFAIEKFSNQGLIMDFEGSETPEFARFYEQYGAKDSESYFYFKLNNLPFPLKWLK